MKVVAKEFEFQGYTMRGPRSSLAHGKKKNVSRDIQRDYKKRNLDPVSFFQKWSASFWLSMYLYSYICCGLHLLKNQQVPEQLQVPVRLIDIPVHKQRGVQGIESRRGNPGFWLSMGNC